MAAILKQNDGRRLVLAWHSRYSEVVELSAPAFVLATRPYNLNSLSSLKSSTHGSKRRTRGMPVICSTCYFRTSFRVSGFRHQRSGLQGNCYGIGASSFAYEGRR
jgi:hypothetical protein